MAKRADRARAITEFEDDLDDLCEAPRARRRRFRSRAASRKAEEVDRNASPARLERAAKRLKSAHAAERVLAVPQWNMDKAVEAMKRAGVSGVVTNLCGTRKQRVECDEKKRAAVERTRVDLALDAALDEQLLEGAAIVDAALSDAEATSERQAKPPHLTVVRSQPDDTAPPVAEPVAWAVAPPPAPAPLPEGERPSLELVVENEDVSLSGRLKRAIAKVGGTARSKGAAETRPTPDGRGLGRERA